MSLVLWTSDEDGITMGSPFDLFRAWKELATLVVDREQEFGQLLFVPQTNEETLPADYVAAIQEQARVVLAEYQPGDHLRWCLERIVAGEGDLEYDEAADDAAEESPDLSAAIESAARRIAAQALREGYP